MKLAPPELHARKALAHDASAEDDTRDRSPQFELTLLKLRDQTATLSDQHGSDDLASDEHDGLSHERRRAVERLDADAMSEDQVLSATGTNPVLAALAATRAWQSPTLAVKDFGGDGLTKDLSAGGVRESMLSRASLAYVGNPAGPQDTSNVRQADASNVRRSAVTLTPDQASDTLALADDNHTSGVKTPQNDALDAEIEALVASQNYPQNTAIPGVSGAKSEGLSSANVPALPIETAQRLIDGTVAALRIDRDTAHPQHSASIIEVRHPELGVVRAEVRLRGDAMEVRFEASNAVAATLLRASESVLRKALSQHGLRLRNLQVDARSTLMQERARRTRRHLLDLEA